MIQRLRMRVLTTTLLASACLIGLGASQAHAQSSPGWFVPSQQAPAESAPARGRARASAPAPEAAAEAPPPPAPDVSDEAEQAEAQRKAALLPQPPPPPLPPILSPITSLGTTGDAVRVSASGANAALPAPLAADTTYYLIKTGDNAAKLAASASDAASGTAISLTTEGSGALHLLLPKAASGQTNVSSDFSVTLPGELKLLAGGAAPPVAAIGVLGVPDVMRASSAYQAVDKVINARKEKLQAEAQHVQADWRDLQNRLKDDVEAHRITREQAVAKLQGQISAERHRLQEQGRMIQEAAQVAQGQIERTLINVIRQVAESRNMNLVLHRSQVALNIQAFDITDAVAAQLNRALPTVQIPPDGVDPATLPRDWGSKPAAAQ